MKIVKFLLAIAIIFVGTVHATSIYLTNNSSYKITGEVLPWGGFADTKSMGKVPVLARTAEGKPFLYDIAANTTFDLKPGEKSSVYTTQGIEGLIDLILYDVVTHQQVDGEVALIGKDGKDYLDNLKVPKGQIWELEFKNK